MKHYKAFSLIEILVAVTLFGMVFASVVGFSARASEILVNMRARDKANETMMNVYNSIMISKRELWGDIVSNADGQPKHVEYSSGTPSIVDGEYIDEEVSYHFIITQALRSAGEISDSGSYDVRTYKIMLTIEWDDRRLANQTKTETFYINDWNLLEWAEDLDADFSDGNFLDTILNPESTGEIQLVTAFYPDWCKPSLTLSTYDLPGSGIAETISIDGAEIVTGTGQNASGYSFTKLESDEGDPPTLSVLDDYDGGKTNDITNKIGFSYLATDTNGAEVSIIQTSTSPYTQVGYFDSPGPNDAMKVKVSDTTGYVLVSDKLYSFDLSSNYGARGQLGMLDFPDNLTAIELFEDYAFVTSQSPPQLYIVDISNPTNLSILSQLALNGGAGRALDISEDGNRAYIATQNDATKDEVFIVNIEDKEGTQTVIKSLDTSPMDPKTVQYVDDDYVLLVGGTGGLEYQAFDVETEGSAYNCGGMEITSQVNAMATTKDALGNKFTFIVTEDSTNEVKILKGGQGGGGADGYGHVESGTYESNVYDSGNDTPTYYSISWNGDVIAGTDLQIQIRTGDSPDLSAQPWLGPDGTVSTFYTNQSATLVHASASGHRYIQYKLYMTSDTVNTPYFDKIMLYYQ